MKRRVGITSLILLLQITFFLVMGSAFCMVQAQDLQKKYDPQKLKSDIDSLVKYIEDTHPDPYYRYPKDSFYSDIADVKRQINKPYPLYLFTSLLNLYWSGWKTGIRIWQCPCPNFIRCIPTCSGYRSG